MKQTSFFEHLLLVEAVVPPEGGKVDASKSSEAIREVRVTRGCFSMVALC